MANQESPYMMMREETNYTGNARFYGFCVDILDRVSQEVGFDYILDLVVDRKYGAQDPETGEWNGMVKQLMQHVSNVPVSVLPSCLGRLR
jgi:glutamate receptor, ionotropic, invertebrate